MGSPFLGEFMGTLVLILLGDGVVAGVLLKRSKAEGGGWMVITSGWAFAVMAGVFTAMACGSKEAYLNPAVTLGFAVSSGNYSNFLGNVAAELFGAFCGAVLVWMHFGPHWKETPDAPAKLAIFCTVPGDPQRRMELHQRSDRYVDAGVLVATIFSKQVAATGRPGLDPIWWARWSGGSDFLWAVPPATRSIPRAIWDRASRTPCCRSQERADRIGAMRRFRFSDRCWARDGRIVDSLDPNLTLRPTQTR